MACSGCVRIGYAVRGVARSRVRMLFRRRTSLLVARYPALAERRAVAAVVHCFIPFLCHLAVRRAFRVSYLLRPRCLSVLPVRESAFRYFTSPRPGVCGRPDVGLRDVCLFGPSGVDHNAIALFSQRPRFEPSAR